MPPRGRAWFLLLWFLPVVDLFAMGRILGYYAGRGVRVPRSHARLAMVERWVGYLPAGFLVGRWLGPLGALSLFLLGMLLAGPLEVLLMWKGRGPWRFLRGRGGRLLVWIFLLEGYNALGYFAVGILLGIL
ncbi:MAG: hypothetical protein QW098_03340 [Candidatus Hadarchaeales archaeon]